MTAKHGRMLQNQDSHLSALLQIYIHRGNQSFIDLHTGGLVPLWKAKSANMKGKRHTDRDDRYFQIVRQAFQEIQGAALLAVRSGQEVMGFVDYEHLRLYATQNSHGERLERNQTLRRGEGCVKGFEEPCEEASLLRGGGHIYNDDRRFRDPGFVIVGRRMQAHEFLDRHGFSHATIPIEQQAGHSTAGGIIEPPFQFIENPLHTLMSDPAGFLDVPNPRYTGFKCLLTHVLGEVREIQRHRRGPSSSLSSSWVGMS